MPTGADDRHRLAHTRAVRCRTYGAADGFLNEAEVLGYLPVVAADVVAADVAADRTGSTWIFTKSSTPKKMQVQAPVSSALQGRRPNGRYGCDRTGPRRGCCHCRHERVQAGVGENWRQYSYLSGSSMDLEGVRIATPPNVTRAMIRRYQYHQPGALAEGGGQALEEAIVPDIVETFPNVQIRAVRGAVLLPRFVEKGQRAHNKRCIPLQSWRLGDFYLCVPIW